MKRIVVLVVLLSLIISPASASVLDRLEGEKQILEADAPYLVRFNPDWSLGTEISKDVRDTSTYEGWSFGGKITYTGTWFDMSPKVPEITEEL